MQDTKEFKVILSLKVSWTFTSKWSQLARSETPLTRSVPDRMFEVFKYPLFYANVNIYF